ncbi:kinesin-4-like [Dorcoceras hygrometricum]|uniref:Kinesin-4-like n=1 Tax=Dorcoceras hygrometricum TaxID=472368 RepID=A0A2Z7BNK9_9LAMI|nr:kinesin-4-like [Dorcoceras hygrometricum]
MASSFYSNSQHVDFESVLSMDDQVDFFENASVREGVIISTVAGQLVEISEELFAKSFELPVDGLGDLSEIPKDAIFYAKSIVSLSGEPVSLSGRKNQMKFEYRLLCDIMAKAISVKAGSFNAITRMVTPGSKQAKGFAIQISLLLANIPNLELGASSEFPASKILTKKTVHRFISINDRDGAEEAPGATKQRAASKKRPAADVVAAVTKKKRTSQRKLALETMVVAQEALPIQSVHVSTAVAPMVEDQQAEFKLIAKWAAERPVASPADSDDEIKDDKPVVDDPDTIINEVLQHLDSTSDDKNVEPVEEAATLDVVTAGEDQQVQEFLAQNANDDLLDADEQQSLDDILLSIPVDVPLPSSGMEITKIKRGEKIKIPEVTEWTWFLNSLPSIPADDKGKEILVEKDPIKGNPAQEHYFLICADIDLLVDLRAKVIDEVAQFFHSFSLKKLATINLEDMYKKEELVLSWGETEWPQVAIQRKLYILIKYREMLLWKFLESWRANFVPGQGSSAVDLKGSSGDRGAVIHQQVISNEVHRQRQYDDTLPAVSEFFRLMRKRWADVCLEVVEFCASRRLLPIGSLQFCRSSSVVEPVFQVASRQSPVFAFRVSQFCSIFVDFSLFNWFPSADISDFLSSIALDRTAFRSAQIYQNSVSVVPSVQLSLDQRPSSPISTDSSSSLRFDTTDVDATVSSLPPVSQDFSAALADLQAILSEQIYESQSGISSRLHKIEQVLCDSLSDQAAIFKNLSQEARQEGRTIDDVQTMRFNEFRKNILAQNTSIFVGLADVRKEVQEVNAKMDIMASRLNDVQKDAEATKEALSHQLFEFQSQAQENQNILHAQLSELVDYIRSWSLEARVMDTASHGPATIAAPKSQFRTCPSDHGKAPSNIAP